MSWCFETLGLIIEYSLAHLNLGGALELDTEMNLYGIRLALT